MADKTGWQVGENAAVEAFLDSEFYRNYRFSRQQGQWATVDFMGKQQNDQLHLD